MALQPGCPLRMAFSTDFVGTDTDVADLAAPRAETRWCLLELPKEQLEALEAGARFSFREEAGGGAVLCSDAATFSVEFLENSNSLFLGAVACTAEARQPPSEAAAAGEAASAGEAAASVPVADAELVTAPLCTIFAQCRGQLILKSAKVNAQRIRDLLAPHVLGRAPATPASAGTEPLPPVTTELLEYEVAASPAELQAMLEEGPYVQHAGEWRLLPAALEREALDVAMTVVTALGLDPGAVDGETLLHEVQQHLGEPRMPSLAVLRKALRSIMVDPAAPAAAAAPAVAAAVAPGATPLEPAPTDGAVATILESGTASSTGATAKVPSGVISLDRAQMERCRALQLLRDPPSRVRERFQLPTLEPRPKRQRLGAAVGTGREAPLRVEELVAAFRELADAEATSETVLKLVGDYALVDEFEATVHPLDVTTLPQDPRERLAKLFDLQSHWRSERMAGFILPVLGGGQKVDPWLMKWTRAVFVEIEPGGGEQRMLTRKFAGAGL